MGSNSVFRFKRFVVHQDQCAMKVTSDACIFGACIDLSSARRILDIGTGTGLLALMAAQKTDASIEAIEIDEPASVQAKQNIKASPWRRRISVQNLSLQEYAKKAIQDKVSFDAIICNPPFYHQEKRSKDHVKRVAWHDEKLRLDELVSYSKQLLTAEGCLYVLLPNEDENRYLSICQERGLYPLVSYYLHSFPDSNPKRVIVVHGLSPIAHNYQKLVIWKSHQVFSEECKELLKPYFLNL